MKKITKVLLSQLGSSEGWKRDFKKILKILVLLVVAVAVWIALKASGTRFVFKVEHFAPMYVKGRSLPISFSYSSRYQLDSDEEKRFGENYIIGFKLPGDPRTGCDLRLTDVRLNMGKGDAEISAAVNGQLASAAKDFKPLSSERIGVGGEEGLRTDFTMKDPIGATIFMRQVLVSHGERGYVIACGAQESLFEYLSSDFDDFISSIKWK